MDLEQLQRAIEAILFAAGERIEISRLAFALEADEVDIIAGEEESEDTYPLFDNGAFANLEALLRDTLVDELPLQPLCREDCRGLCSQCGVDLNENPDHVHETTDIRFAGLADLKAKLESEQQG